MRQSPISAPKAISYPLPAPHARGTPGGRAAPWRLGEGAPRPRVRPASWDAGALRSDALAIAVRSALERVAVPLARAAAAFARERAWCLFGHARLEDHARERFGRSGRWVRDLASLGEAFARLPGLEDALSGDDGGSPLGRVAALLIGRVATPESLRAWVALARRVTVRELRASVRRSRVSGLSWPEGKTDGPADGDASPDDGCDRSGARGAEGAGVEAVDDEDTPRHLVRMMVPAAVRAAFDEALDLHRAVEGRQASVTSFVEALAAEASSGPDAGPLPGELDRVPLNSSDPRAEVEAFLARATRRWSHLPVRARPSWALSPAGAGLRRFEELSRQAGQGHGAELDAQLRQLIVLEDHLERRLGDVLAEMSAQGAWRALRFDGCGHYAEQRLGLSRSGASDRLRAARGLMGFPLVRQAYLRGELGLEAALHLIAVLRDSDGGEVAVRPWLDLARSATVKRLRDEVRLWRAAGGGAVGGGAAGGGAAGGGAAGGGAAGREVGADRPGDDGAWQASLRREYGAARARVARFGATAAAAVEASRSGGMDVPDVFLRLRLPARVASDLLVAVEAARIRRARLAGSVAWDEPWPDPDPPASLRAARQFFVRCRRAPAWVGLLALLEQYVEVWDATVSGRPPGAEAVYIRDGWRCTAPGCSSRRNLEDHHIVYRSGGGGDDLDNRTCVCRFHHQRGEHGGLASCRGQAPLGLVWRLGRRGIGGRFRNERRVD